MHGIARNTHTHLIPGFLIPVARTGRVVQEVASRVERTDFTAGTIVQSELHTVLVRTHAHKHPRVKRIVHPRVEAHLKVGPGGSGVDQAACTTGALATGDRAILHTP